jgi:hypothetical protein
MCVLLVYQPEVSGTSRRSLCLDVSAVTRGSVAATTGFSTTHVSDVIAGKYFNDKIVNEAYDVTRGRISNAVKLSSLMA